jgi:predicted metal-binding membrane protein
MLVLLAVGAMGVVWMCVIGAIVVAQKLLPPRPLLDVALALALIGLGIAIAAAPWSIASIT